MQIKGRWWKWDEEETKISKDNRKRVGKKERKKKKGYYQIEKRDNYRKMIQL